MLLQMALFHSNNRVLLHCIHVPHILYAFVCCGHLGSFHVLAIVNSAYLPLFLCDLALVFTFQSFLVAQMVKLPACNAGDPGSVPGLGRSPGEGNGNPLQYSCLENSMDGGTS